MKGDAAVLFSVVEDVAVGLLALPLGACDLLGAGLEDGLDGCPSHYVNDFVEAGLGRDEKIEQGWDELAILGEEFGDSLAVEVGLTAKRRDDLVSFRHRRWLQGQGLIPSR